MVLEGGQAGAGGEEGRGHVHVVCKSRAVHKITARCEEKHTGGLPSVNRG
jgi:hypothetical protein